MTHRYTGVIGKKLEGAGSETHQGTARLLVQQCINEINYRGGQGNASRFKILADGTRVRAVVLQSIKGMPPVVRVDIQTPDGREEERPIKIIVPSVFLAAVWIPEGLIITPRTEVAPYGYGFPKRDRETGERINAPYGTRIEEEEDECYNQCLFNKFENNKYIDHPDHIVGLEEFFTDLPDNPRLRDAVEDPVPEDGLPPYRHWQFLFEPVAPPAFDRSFWDENENRILHVDLPGLNVWPGLDRPFIPFKTEGELTEDEDTREPLIRQFGDTLDEISIYESEREGWFCHWPEECLYENRTFESIFQECNRLRGEAGREPLLRPIRGHSSGAWHTVVEMQIAGVQFHNSDQFRPGYQTFAQRIIANRLFVFGGTGENLLTAPVGDLNSVSVGERLNRYWEESPPHYANIVSASWGSPKNSTFLDVGGGAQVTLTETENTGYSFAQWFCGAQKAEPWLHFGKFYNETPYGKVSVGCRYPWLGAVVSGANYDRTTVFYAGRVYFINQMFGGEGSYVSGATLFLHESNTLWFRAMCIYDSHLKVFVLPLNSTNNTGYAVWEEEASFDLRTLGAAIRICSLTTFSRDGTKAVISVAYVIDNEYAEFLLENHDDRPPRVQRLRNAQASIEYSNGDFIVTPDEDFIIKYEGKFKRKYTDGGTPFDELVEYKQSGEKEFQTYPFYDLEGNKQWLTYRSSIYSVDYSEGESPSGLDRYMRWYEEIEFPSGYVLPLVDYELEDLRPKAGYDNFFITILYCDPRTEDIVYAKLKLGYLRDQPHPRHPQFDVDYVMGTLEFWYNDTLIKQYPEQRVGTRGSGRYNTLDYRDWDFTRKGAVYGATFINFMLTGLVGGSSFYFFPAFSNPSLTLYCAFRPDIVANSDDMFTGEFPACRAPREAYYQYCFSSSDPVPRIRALVFSPALSQAAIGGGAGTEAGTHTEDVMCRFARYKDRVAFQISFKQLYSIQSEDPEFDRIIWANFDMEEEVGIGPLTQIAPLGVV